MASRFALFFLFLAFVISVVIRNPMLFLLNLVLLSIVFVSWLWGRYCLAAVTYTRRFTTDRLFPGEETDLWIEVVNAKPMPLTWLRAEDEVPYGLGIIHAHMPHSARPQRRILTNLFSLRWYERVRRRYRLKSEVRGAFDLGPVYVTSGDPFGFRVRRREITARQTILVYPKIVSIDQFGLPPARPMGDYGTERRIIEDPWRVAGARDYQVGDNVRYVHWKATAHRGTLQTKLFDPSASPHWLVCLNTQTLERLYEGVIVDYLETAIVVAASIAYAGLESRRSVGLASNSAVREAMQWAYLPASRHAQQTTTILEALAQLTHPPLLPFESMLHAAAPRFPFGASIFVVTPLVTAAILDTLLELRRAGHPLQLVAVGQSPKASIPPEIPWCLVEQNWTEMQSLKL
jgi:uncharacterized protein (DUF58 family)